jgi:glycosyltransferase involved in cell wall biosynthesis
MPPTDLVCLSHLRWDFVYQRPQHLMTRFAKHHRVFFVEEPVVGPGPEHLAVKAFQPSLILAVPQVTHETARDPARLARLQQQWMHELCAAHGIDDYVLWYSTPMALSFSRELAPALVVYDCMDQLAGFAGAPASMTERELELLERADLVFTGGQSLYEAKRGLHPAVHAFPSSVDAAHFRRGRDPQRDPADQVAIPHPRLGYAGVIDERMDLDLVRGLARARPDWHLVLVGPVLKIPPSTLPIAPNIHYLGMKAYPELPSYIGGWDVALLPFAHNEATRYISPTKTPEYLAAGRPVVSTSIRDVVRPYGTRGLVAIADTVADTVAAVEVALAIDLVEHQAAADRFLARMSWDETTRNMLALIEEARRRQPRHQSAERAAQP